MTQTSGLGSVALLQADINLHERHMLDLNLEPKSGLKNDVERRCVEDVDVTYRSSEITREEVTHRGTAAPIFQAKFRTHLSGTANSPSACSA